jgi:hypothetical protein
MWREHGRTRESWVSVGPEGIESDDRAEGITLSQNDNHVKKKKKNEEWKVQRHYTKHA